MITTRKYIMKLSALVLSAMVLFGSASVALARPDRGRVSDRHNQGRSGFDRHDNDRSRFRIGFDWGTRFDSRPYSYWVPGRYETHIERVLVEQGHYEWEVQNVEVEPAHFETCRIPAVQETRYDADGKPYQVILEPARTEKIWVPARYEQRRDRVWIPDRYEEREVRVWVSGYWVNEPNYGLRDGSRIRIGGTFRF